MKATVEARATSIGRGEPEIESERTFGGARRPFRHSPTALLFQRPLSYAEWRRVGSQVAMIHSGSAWWIGDWVRYGQAAFGRRYRQALKETSLEYQTLRNYAWVASRVAPEQRTPSLSFQHHAEVAPLPPEDQQMWLMRARLHNWTRNQLRRQIRTARSGEPAEAPAAEPLTIEVEAERRARWHEAAAAGQQTLEEWIRSVLDREAYSILARAAA